MKSVVTDGPEELSFVMPPRRSVRSMIIIPVWMVGWVLISRIQERHAIPVAQS